MIEWIWNNLVGFLLGSVPWPVWLIVAGLLLGWAWRTFGWQGLVGAAAAILTLGIYRQGWRDGRAGKADPIEHLRPTDPDAAPSPKRKKRSSILGGSILPWNRK